jgi:acyl-coenzyme A synthetase/AMP-(fatty) acid ligase
VQIENVLASHPDIQESAVVAVPDSKYGEVVGAWILCQPGKHLTRDEVRRWVADSMNPQVCIGDDLKSFTELPFPRTLLPGYGSLGEMALRMNYPRQLVARS